MLTKYSIFNSITLFIIAFSVYFYNVFGFLLSYDPTRFSFLIFGIYAALTTYLGLSREKANLNLVHFVSNRLTSLGLIGTVIGIMLLLHTVGASNLANVSDVVVPLFKGMSTLLITTLCGMTFSLLMDFQLSFVYGKTSNDE